MSGLAIQKSVNLNLKEITENLIVKQSLALELIKPAQYIGLIASVALGVYAASSLPWNLAGKFIGGALMQNGANIPLQHITFFVGWPLFSRTEAGKAFIALGDTQFIQFAKSQQMFTPDTIVKAHKLYQEKLAAPAA